MTFVKKMRAALSGIEISQALAVEHWKPNIQGLPLTHNQACNQEFFSGRAHLFMASTI